MKLHPTNTLYKGCRVWLECDTISTANSIDYIAEVGQAPLIVFQKLTEADPIERDYLGRTKKDGATPKDDRDPSNVRPKARAVKSKGKSSKEGS